MKLPITSLTERLATHLANAADSLGLSVVTGRKATGWTTPDILIFGHPDGSLVESRGVLVWRENDEPDPPTGFVRDTECSGRICTTSRHLGAQITAIEELLCSLAPEAHV